MFNLIKNISALKSVNSSNLLRNSFNMFISNRNREDVGAREHYTAINFKSKDECLLEGWIYRAPKQACDRGTTIILHGFSVESSTMTHFAEVFSKQGNITVMAYDQRYHGWSSTDDYFPTFGRYEADDLIAAMDYAESIGLPQPFTFFGISLGAMASQIAAIEDSRVAGAVLVAPPAWPRHAVDCMFKKTSIAFTPIASRMLHKHYKSNVLGAGDLRNIPQAPDHRPLICYVMGDADQYDINRTKMIFDYWHNQEPGIHNQWPSQHPECRKFFMAVPKADHYGETTGYAIYDWPELENFFFDFLDVALAKKH